MESFHKILILQFFQHPFLQTLNSDQSFLETSPQLSLQFLKQVLLKPAFDFSFPLSNLFCFLVITCSIQFLMQKPQSFSFKPNGSRQVSTMHCFFWIFSSLVKRADFQAALASWNSFLSCFFCWGVRSELAAWVWVRARRRVRAMANFIFKDFYFCMC